MEKMKHNPLSLQELKKLRKPLRDVSVEARGRLSKLDRLAVWVTKHVGTMGFFLVIAAWTVGWLGWNVFAPLDLRFDPYPAFVFWLFISNLIQILLLPLIMVGQNLQSHRFEARAEADFEVNLKAERELEAILGHLENQNELIFEIAKKLERERKI
ncbi:DUF1003 domain-containing protein [Candidatus Giovannonibacteria bacterium]|nr:DUF1003 domain-containing protein [Candidatus Giovannonibacteria bacterium]